MAEKSTDIRSRTDDAVRELGEIDSLVNDLEDEIEGAAEDLARAAGTGEESESVAKADPIADAADELDEDASMSAQSVDDALEKVAAEIQSDMDDASAAVDDARSAFDESAGEDSIAAQIDEELARALDEREDDDDAEPVAQAAAPVEAQGAVEASDEDDSEPADPQATDEAVHALAEALDRLLDEDEESGEAEDGVEEGAEPAAEADDEAEVAAPAAPVAKPTEPKTVHAPKPEPKRAPAQVAVVDTKTEQPRSFSPNTVLISALALANKPFESLPQQVRETIGLAGLVTIFNAACLWVFLLLR